LILFPLCLRCTTAPRDIIVVADKCVAKEAGSTTGRGSVMHEMAVCKNVRLRKSREEFVPTVFSSVQCTLQSTMYCTAVCLSLLSRKKVCHTFVFSPLIRKKKNKPHTESTHKKTPVENCLQHKTSGRIKRNEPWAKNVSMIPTLINSITRLFSTTLP
jgi:hypothetical protein